MPWYSNEGRAIILSAVVKAVEEDPSFFRDIVNACNEGVIQARNNAYARACDMETALVSIVAMQKKGQRNKRGLRALAVSMLERYRNNTAMAWKSYEEDFPELKQTNGENDGE